MPKSSTSTITAPIDLHGRFLAVVRILEERGSADIATVLEHPQGPSVLLEILRELTCPGTPIPGPVDAPISGDDYHTWSEGKRLRAALDALRVLRKLDCEGRIAPTQDERAYLLAFSGWGGLDLTKIPLSADILPPRYLEALREWQLARRNELVDAQGRKILPKSDLWQGVLQQYFTPVPMAQAMQALARNWGVITPVTALEPSAGIGRLVQDFGAQWTLVEQDPLLAAMLRALYGATHTIVEAPFESYAATAHARYDLCLQNPPYPKRPAALASLDPAWAAWHKGHVYTAIRAWDLLHPGGLLVTLVPGGAMSGNDVENRGMRNMFLKGGHLYTAYMPPGDLFRKIGALPASGLVVTVWIKTGTTIRERLGWSDRDQAILDGRYFETEEGQSNLGGTGWGSVGRYSYGTRDGEDPNKGMIRIGPFDPEHMSNSTGIRLPPWANELLHQENTAAKAIQETEVKTVTQTRAATLRASGVMLNLTAAVVVGTVEDQVQTAHAMELRLSRYRDLLKRDPALAEDGRPELRYDIQYYLQIYGNPHTAEALLGHHLPTLNLTITQTGELPEWLNSPVAERSKADNILTKDNPTIPQAVAWYSNHQGWCSDRELLRHGLPVDPEVVLAANDEICLEIRPDIGSTYIAKEDYLTGDLHARLRRISEVTATPGSLVAQRLEQQGVWLSETIGHLSISEIEVNPRSGFVPLECLQEYAVATLKELRIAMQGRSTTINALTDIGLTLVIEKNRLRAQFTSTPHAEHGILRWISSPAARKDNKVYSWLIFFLGYWNRDLQLTDPRDESKAVNRYVTTDPEDRLREDHMLEEHFATWVGGHSDWSQRLEAVYNQTFRGTVPKRFNKTPIALARMAPTVQLYDHQNEAARAFSERLSGIAAHDTGAGKTKLGAAVVGMARQKRAIQRAMIVVPNNTLANWYREIRAMFPDYRIGLIGQTWDSEQEMDNGAIGGLRSDTGRTAERHAKWVKFRDGGYDVLVCAYSAYTRDVALTDKSVWDILSGLWWAQRGLGKDEDAKRLTEHRLAAARADWNKRVDQYGADDETAQELAARIARYTEELKNPSDSMLEKARQDLEEFAGVKPFRPRDKNGVIPHIVTMEELRVDLLIVDEAQNFKNLFGLESVVGEKAISYLGNIGDKVVVRTWDMFLKCQHILREHADRGVLLLTATPIKNSPLEVYNLLSLVSRNIWEVRHVRNAQEFRDRYLVLETEVTPNITGEIGTNLAVTGFKNLDELRAMMALYVDRRPTSQLLASGALRSVPKANIHREILPTDSEQRRLTIAVQTAITSIREILEATIKGSSPEKGALGLFQLDMLQKVALDPRLMALDYLEIVQESGLVAWKAAKTPAPPQQYQSALAAGYQNADGTWTFPKRWSPKIPKKEIQRQIAQLKLQILEACSLDETLQYYRENIPPKYQRLIELISARATCGHLVFVDNNECGGWVRDALIAHAGIPAKRIVLLTAEEWDSDERQGVVDAFNGTEAEIDPETGAILAPAIEPTYDIVIGNSATMAEGLNLQRRTCAIHHLDLPWEPASIQQRNGRGVRQGNRYPEVDVYYYIMERSFDGYKLDSILGKLNWQDGIYDVAAGRRIDNPAQGLAEGREEIVIEMTAIDPEAAKMQLAEVRLKRQARRRFRLLRETCAALDAINMRYAEARYLTQEGHQAHAESVFTIGEVRSARMRADTVVRSILPMVSEMLDRSRQTLTTILPDAWYMPESGGSVTSWKMGEDPQTYSLDKLVMGAPVSVGEHVWLVECTEDDNQLIGMLRKRVEILHIWQMGGLAFRCWGEIQVRTLNTMLTLGDGRMALQFGGHRYSYADKPTAPTPVLVAPCSPTQWNGAEDAQHLRKQVNSLSMYRNLDPQVRAHLDPTAIWRDVLDTCINLPSHQIDMKEAVRRLANINIHGPESITGQTAQWTAVTMGEGTDLQIVFIHPDVWAWLQQPRHIPDSPFEHTPSGYKVAPSLVSWLFTCKPIEALGDLSSTGRRASRASAEVWSTIVRAFSKGNVFAWRTPAKKPALELLDPVSLESINRASALPRYITKAMQERYLQVIRRGDDQGPTGAERRLSMPTLLDTFNT